MHRALEEARLPSAVVPVRENEREGVEMSGAPASAVRVRLVVLPSDVERLGAVGERVQRRAHPSRRRQVGVSSGS